VGLSVRHDINKHKYIPKLYSKDHKNDETSLLYAYIHGITYKEPHQVPTSVKTFLNKHSDIKLYSKTKHCDHTTCVKVDYEGKFIDGVINSTNICYEGKIIGKFTKTMPNIKPGVQLLNSSHQRIAF